MKDHVVVLSSLRRTKTEHVPKRKQELIDLFAAWRDKTPIPLTELGVDVDVDGVEEEDNPYYENVDVDGSVAM